MSLMWLIMFYMYIHVGRSDVTNVAYNVYIGRSDVTNVGYNVL